MEWDWIGPQTLTTVLEIIPCHFIITQLPKERASDQECNPHYSIALTFVVISALVQLVCELLQNVKVLLSQSSTYVLGISQRRRNGNLRVII